MIRTIRAAAPECPIILDTEGPEIRLVNVPHPIKLTTGQEFVFSTSMHAHMAHTTHPVHVTPGTTVLFDDGNITLIVERVHEQYVTCRVQNEAILTDRRKVTVPGGSIALPVLSERDVTNLRFCLDLGADAVALSFTQRADDIAVCRDIVGPHVTIIAKIENRLGVENAEHIIREADGVMIARGDLGVEIPLEEVPQVQKRLVRLANTLGKTAIVATQMLESMTHNPIPTRAEVSDVANAIMDGADAVMLSGETARGAYPVATVSTMARIAQETDKYVLTTFRRGEQGRISSAEAISAAVYDMATSLGAQAIITATTSGFTARMVSRFRPHVPIIAVAHDERIKRQLQLVWGVTPVIFENDQMHAHDTIPRALKTALLARLVREDDLIVATAGINTRKRGSTNLIEIHRVRDIVDVAGGHRT
jgi:pyruvate kinase